MKTIRLFTLVGILLTALRSDAQTAGMSDKTHLVIADAKVSDVTIVVSPDAGKAEKQAASDLGKYIGMMAGATPAIASSPETIAAALKANRPVLLVGSQAIKAEPSLQKALNAVAEKKPTLRADAIVVRRNGNRVYLAGTNDESHYFAVAHLLQLWGCRWYLQGEFGECIPQHPTLRIGQLDTAYAPPFEIRSYWISWNGEQAGRPDFMLRNFMSSTSVAGGGHALATYTADLAPEGKSPFSVPFAEEATAKQS